MAEIFADDFESYHTNADIGILWTQTSQFFVTACPAYRGFIGIKGRDANYMYRDLGSNKGTLIFGAAFQPNYAAGTSTRPHILQMWDVGTEQMTIRLNDTSRKFEVYRGGTLLQTGTFVMAEDVWAYLEFKVVFATGATGSYELRIDGVTDMSATNVQTAVSANAYGNRISINGIDYPGPEKYYDEIYVDDSTFHGVPAGEAPLAGVGAHDCALLRRLYYPSVVVMPNGQPGMLVRAQPSPYGVTANQVYFVAHNAEDEVRIPVTSMFNYDTYEFELVNWQSKLYAICWKPSTQAFVYRKSTDNGLTWTAEATFMADQSARDYHPGGNAGNSRGIRFVTNKAGTELYFFFRKLAMVNVSQIVQYRMTTDADPSGGWSAEATTGFTIPTIGRNYGGPNARNEQDTRPFSGPLESKTAGTWVIGAESDDGDWHANHAIFRGTIGGSWSRVFNDTYGGGVSGNQGSNGDIVYTSAGDLLCTMMADEGGSMGCYISTDSGANWLGGEAEMPFGTVVGMGQHSGVYVPAWGHTYIWGGLAGLLPFSTEKTDLYFTLLGAPGDFTDILGESGIYGCTFFDVCLDPNPGWVAAVIGPNASPADFTGSALTSAPSTGQGRGSSLPDTGQAKTSAPSTGQAPLGGVTYEAPKSGSARTSSPEKGSARSDS